MSVALGVGIIRLAIAALGLGVNVWTGWLIHAAQGRAAVAFLTRGEQNTMTSAAFAGRNRFLEHAGFAAVASYLVTQQPQISWPSFVLMTVQIAVMVNDLKAALTVRRVLRLGGGS